MCKPGCVCDKCWTNFFEVRFPKLVAALVLRSIASPEPPQEEPEPEIKDAPQRRRKAHAVPKVRHQRRKPRASPRKLVDVAPDPVAEPVELLAPQPDPEESSPRAEEAPDEGSRDLRTVTESEAAAEPPAPVVEVRVPRPRFPQMDFRSSRPVPVRPKRTVPREKALKETRLEKMRSLLAAKKPKEKDPEEEAPKSLEDEDMEALQFGEDLESELKAGKLSAALIE